MWNNLSLLVLGISFGLLSSSGVFTVLISVGLIPRFARRTRTEKCLLLYEETVILGTILGGIYSLFPIAFEISSIVLQLLMLTLYGLFSGIFVGCLALAIAEMLNAIPVFARRLRFHKILKMIVYAMAFGKVVGSLVYFYFTVGILTS